MMSVEEILTQYDARHGVVNVDEIRFDPSFRALCEANSCGYYGKCWTCPPDAGTIEELMQKAKSYQTALVFQTVSKLEDSFDIEGMHEASLRHNKLVQRIRDAARREYPDCLVLGAGACGVCAVCSKRENKPCRFPDKAITSLEACGIDVSQAAKLAGMRYINGENTVTYFGMVLYSAKQ
jgi:predicted metal-binding protein